MALWVALSSLAYASHSVSRGSASPLNTGKIAGRVVDGGSGEPLPGVNVIIVGTQIGAVTDLDGSYSIINVPPGTYSLQFSFLGFSRLTVENVRVTVDLTTRINAEMREEVIQGEEVLIVAERPLVIKDQTSSAAVVTSEELAALPLENFEEAVTLQTGVVQDAEGGIHIRGGRANEIQYIVDGIAVTDPFSGTIGVQVENNTIEELTVISGTFNAEFGQAQSGVINITTKSGSDTFEGNAQVFTGSYLTGDNRYLTIGTYRPLSVNDVQGFLSGPIPGTRKKMTFFASGRWLQDDGYLWGQRWFNVGDDSDFSSPSAEDWIVSATGDSSEVSLNNNESISFQGKLAYDLGSGIKVTLSGSSNESDFREYDHDFKYNPDGDYSFSRAGNSLIFTWNHALNAKTFYVIRGARVFSESSRFAFDNPLDQRQAPPSFLERPPLNFATGGNKSDHLNRSTTTYTGKVELTSQVTPVHLMKVGVETKYHELDFQSFLVVVDEDTGIPSIDPAVQGPFGRDEYTVNPIEIAAYIQDKIELEQMIVNVGIRFDYFDSGFVLPADLRNPTESAKVDADIKTQISPRIGVAYPISERGMLYFSYGHFFQIPPFEFLYSNPDFEIRTGGLNTIVGNANLEPEQTVAYEFGLQQQLSDDIVLEAVGFYKDIRNLLGTELFRTTQQTRYARYTNRDFGNVRGLTISLEKRRRRNQLVGLGLDYTFSVAEGNASDPDAVFLDNVSVPPIESESQVVPLDWDQRHTLNAAINVGGGDWNVGLIGRFGSGQPYTPTPFGRRTTAFPENSESKPLQATIDLQASKSFSTERASFTLFLKVFNLFDRRNPIEVYSDTGRPDATIITGRDERPIVVSSLDDFINRLDFYAPPREIRFGVGIRF